jgi:CRP-like cAMP-binding protein
MKKEGIYNIVEEKTYDEGQVIFNEDSIEDGLFIIISGSVETSKSVQGRRFVIETLQPGDIFGEMELAGEMNMGLTARAVQKTMLGVIDREPFHQEYNQLSRQFRNILESIPVRLKKMLDRACDFSG